MPTQDLPEAVGMNPSAGTDRLPEDDDAYELQDHEFTLEADETLEFPTQAPPPGAPSQYPPLPHWAGLSRALLDTSLDSSLDPVSKGQQDNVDAIRTMELPALRASHESELAPREQLEHLRLRLEAREVLFHEVDRALSVATGRMRGQAFRIAELEIALSEVESAQRAAPPLPSPSPSPSSVDAGDDAPIAQAPAETAKPPRKPRAQRRDDLLKIRGIGPRIAKRLHEAGIVSFRAIAAWSAKDTARVAKQIGVTRERIERERWVKQASALVGPRAKVQTPRAS